MFKAEHLLCITLLPQTVSKSTFPVFVNCTNLYPNTWKSPLPRITCTKNLHRLTDPCIHTYILILYPLVLGNRPIYPNSEEGSPYKPLSKTPYSKSSFGKNDHLLLFKNFTV